MGRNRKLSDVALAEVRAWYAARSNLATPGEICKHHNISSSLLSQICRGIAYKAKRVSTGGAR